jgi:hypothetical protein
MRAKLVNEKFEEQSDPIKDMGIGMRHSSVLSKMWEKPNIIKSGEKVKYLDNDGNFHYGTYIRDTMFRGEFSALSMFLDPISIINDDELGRIKVNKNRLKRV